jgi:hypothetical protein
MGGTAEGCPTRHLLRGDRRMGSAMRSPGEAEGNGEVRACDRRVVVIYDLGFSRVMEVGYAALGGWGLVTAVCVLGFGIALLFTAIYDGPVALGRMFTGHGRMARVRDTHQGKGIVAASPAPEPSQASVLSPKDFPTGRP